MTASTEAPPDPGPGLRELLRGPEARDFRALLLARLASQGADGVFEASLVGFTLFSPQDSPDARSIAASLAAVLLPFSLVGPFAGIALDRISRQRVLLVSGAVRALLMLAVAGLMAAGARGAGLIVLAVIVLSVSRFTGSALSASLPLVVTTEELVTADSLAVTAGGIASLVGAGLGTGIRALVGGGDDRLAVVALVAGVGYAFASLAAARIPAGRLGPGARASRGRVGAEAALVLHDLAAGAAHLWSRRPARLALAAVSLTRVGYGLTFVATVLLFRVHFATPGTTGDLAGLTVVGVTGSAGYVLGAVATPPAARRMGRTTWVAAVLAVAGPLDLALSAPYSRGLLAAAAFVLGFAQQAGKVATDTLMQESVEDAFRGRAFSVYDLSFNACYVVSAALAALLLPPDGRSLVALGLIAACYSTAGVGLAVLSGGWGSGRAGRAGRR